MTLLYCDEARVLKNPTFAVDNYKNEMPIVYLGLGTNLGDREQNLIKTVHRLVVEVGMLIRQSTFYSSRPWGFNSENDFLNAVIALETNLTPFELLSKTQDIEKEMGRTQKSITGYADRLIDIDILFYEDLVLDSAELKIPHPLILERDFVLVPLAEIAPELVHPLTGRKVSSYLC